MKILLLFFFTSVLANQEEEMKLIYHTCDPTDQDRLDAFRFSDLNSVYITKLGQFERFYPILAKKDERENMTKRYLTLCNGDGREYVNKIRVCYSDGKTLSEEFEVDMWTMNAASRNKKIVTLPGARFDHSNTHVFDICMPGGYGTILIIDCSHRKEVKDTSKSAEDEDDDDYKTQNDWKPNRRLAYLHLGFGATIILNALILLILTTIVNREPKKPPKEKSSMMLLEEPQVVAPQPAKTTTASKTKVTPTKTQEKKKK